MEPDPNNPTPDETPVEPHNPEPVPPAAQEPVEEAPYVVPPDQTEEVYQPESIPPAQEAPPVEQVYDYTKGGDQPQIYEQAQEPPSINPPVIESAHQPPPPPVPSPAAQPTARPAMKRPRGAPSRARGAKIPATRARRPGATPYKAPVGSGFSIMSVLMMLVALVLLVLAVMVLSPSNLSGIKGYAASLDQKESRNLLAAGQQVMIGDEEITFTEEEVNHYLTSRLKGVQTGVFGSVMKFKSVCVDFRPDVAEIYLERTFLGIPVTMSSRVKINDSGNSTNWQSAGCRIGKLNLNSEKQFSPILEAFLRLSATCKEEITVINSMSKVKFGEDKLILDSR